MSVDAIRTQLWPLPVTGVVLAVGLGVGMVRLDAWAADRPSVLPAALLFGGDAAAARDVLSAVAGSLITVTALTFSLTIITLQLASSQFSPRLLRTFTADRFVHATLTVFLVTFVFAIIVLPNVRGDDEGGGGGLVPRMSVSLAVVLTLASVVVLVLFLAHLAREIRIEVLLAAVHADTEATIERELPPAGGTESARPPAAGAGAHPVPARTSGFLVAVDQPRLLETAERTGAVLWLDAVLGSSVVKGTPIAFAQSIEPTDGLDDDVLADRIRPCLTIAVERSGAADISFGLRQLSDIAAKALSPAVNDPTTASHALGYSAAVLAQLADRHLDSVLLRDDEDRIRVVLPRPSFADLLDLAVDQPRRYGADEPAIHDRILQLLREVAWSSRRPDQRHAVEAQLERTMTVIGEQDFHPSIRQQLHARADAVRATSGGHWRPADPPS